MLLCDKGVMKMESDCLAAKHLHAHIGGLGDDQGMV
jgi:hypothetical protein